jgi:uncharacterized protein YkwD
MFLRAFVACSLLGWLLVPPSACGQSVEEHHGETIRGAASRAGKGSGGPDLAEVAKVIVQRTNEFRDKEGRPRVAVNPKLTAAARYFADYLARTDKLSHTADGQRPSDRAKKHGYDYCLIAENIAYEYRSSGFGTEELAGRFVEGWKKSPGHRKNMLDPDVTETGVAVARSEQTGYYYAVQEFGRPRSQALAFKVQNASDAAVEYQVGGRTFTLEPGYTRTHELCRPSQSEVTFRWSEGAGKPETVRPRDGDAFAIEKEDGAFRVRKR